jgi:hypothetical protein
VPDLKVGERQDAQGRSPAVSGAARLTRVLGWDPAAAQRSLRRAAATLVPKALWRDHRLFTILVLLSLVPRALAALAFRPALLTSDSFLYMDEAARGTLGTIRPSGYSLLLDVLQPLPHDLLAVTTVQHLMGIGTAVIVYGMLRYWGLPGWGASLAAAPVLFDPREIALESYILPDTLYNLTLVAAAALLLTRRTPRLWQCALAGLLVSYVSVLRGNGLPLAVIFAVFILVRRVGWRAFSAAAVAFAVPLLAYVFTFQSQYGQYNITESDGIFLWSRTTSFADCAVIKPPPDLAPLCPNREKTVAPAGPAPAWSVNALLSAPTPADYLWAPDAWWRHDKYPGINRYNNRLGLHFAIDAIEAQPLGYVRVVARDVALVFVQNDRPLTKTTMSFTVTPHIDGKLPPYYAADEYRYAGSSGNTYLVQPFTYFLLLYQEPVYFGGLMFLFVMAAGLVGVVRRWRAWGRLAALPWALAAASIVLPAMLTQSLYRYTIVAIPLACIAAGMAFISPGRQPALASPAARARAAGGPDGHGPGTTGPLQGPDGDGTREPGTTEPPGIQNGGPGPAATQPLGWDAAAGGSPSGGEAPGPARPAGPPDTPGP